jgi:hypothetical protein
LGFQKPSHTFTKIHLKALHTNNFKLLFALSFTVFINMYSFGQDIPKKATSIKPAVKDSLIINNKTLTKTEVSEKDQDTIPQDSLKNKKKGLLEYIVDYKATDFTSFNQKQQKLYLYNEAEITYGDMNITAGNIIIDYSKK